MCNHGDDNKTNNTTIPEWYFGSVALWHKNRAEWTGQSKGAVNADCPETRWPGKAVKIKGHG